MAWWGLLDDPTAPLENITHDLHDVNDEHRSFTPLTAACCANRADVVKWLLDRGADPSLSVGPMQFTPLMCAVHDLQCCKMLLKAGARVDDLSAAGVSAFGSCAWTVKEGDRLLRLFMNYGANPYTQTAKVWLLPWVFRYHKHCKLRALGAVVCARVATKDTRRLIMKNAI